MDAAPRRENATIFTKNRLATGTLYNFGGLSKKTDTL